MVARVRCCRVEQVHQDLASDVHSILYEDCNGNRPDTSGFYDAVPTG